MSKTHDLKTWPVYFAALRDGTKTFELRRDDRDFEVGDALRLREWNPQDEQYTGRVEFRDVAYILRGSEHLADGYCAISFTDASILACGMLRAERDAALAAKEAAEGDGELLDWLDARSWISGSSAGAPHPFYTKITDIPNDEEATTLREAIRNAMKGEA